jgi:hypothetical protein
MAEFKRSYEENEMEEGDFRMSEGTGLGTGFVGGLIVGGLAGWAFSRDRGGYNYGGYGPAPAPVVVESAGGSHGTDCYTLADVSNLVATKDAQYASLNAAQSSEFNILNTMANNATANAKDMCALSYEFANLNNQTQLQIANNAAESRLCCCQTQGLINQTAAQTQGMIASIVPQMQNFYLADEVEKLRIQSIKSESACQYNSLTTQLINVGRVVDAVYSKVNTSTTTATAAAA